MISSHLKTWFRIVAGYWLLLAVLFFFEIRYMEAIWAGFPGLFLTAPLSFFVLAGALLAELVGTRYGIELNINDYHIEAGFIICGFLNAILFYPAYLFWQKRKPAAIYAPPQPPAT